MYFRNNYSKISFDNVSNGKCQHNLILPCIVKPMLNMYEQISDKESIIYNFCTIV